MMDDLQEQDKKRRKRMKDVRKKIVTQMEFYFSDSNLHKDRFLKQQIQGSANGYIDLDIFLKFNKISQLTHESPVISRALKKSTSLEVNDDGTKVKRRLPLAELTDVDDRTVYVEHLPRHIDHEWVKSLFSQCGNVQYVSLPRFATTGDLKGFGFVEFQSKEEAESACTMLNNPPPLSGKAGRFPKLNKSLAQLNKKSQNIDEPVETDVSKEGDVSKESIDEEHVQKACKKHKKRRHRTSESSVELSVENSSPIKKPKKVESEERKDTETSRKRKANPSSDDKKDDNESKSNKRRKSNSKGNDTVSTETIGKRKRNVNKSCEEEKEESESKSDDSTPVKQSKRKKEGNEKDESDTKSDDSTSIKPKKKKKEVNEKDVDVKTEVDGRKSKKKKARLSNDATDSSKFVVPKDVVSKEEVNSEAKSKKKNRKQKKKNKEKKDVPPPQLRVISKSEWLKLRGEYLREQKASMAAMKRSLEKQRVKKLAEEEKTAKPVKGKQSCRPALGFTPGVIVYVDSSNPMDRKILKTRLPSELNIAYFDITYDATTGYIRCEDSESANGIKDLVLDGYTFSLVEGENEKKYWEKLNSDRDHKFTGKNKPKKRGSQKLIEKVHRHNSEVLGQKKHVVFED